MTTATTRERCPVCDFPLATKEDYETAVGAGVHPLAVAGLCWNGQFVCDHPGPFIDWRARALEAERDAEARVQELEKENSSQKETIARLQTLVEPWRVCAQALADEVDLLVRRQVIDSRSPAADALLDFRNPPTSPRSDRLLSMSWSIQTLVFALERSANNHRLSWSFLDALCSTDTSVDRRKARDNAIQFEKEDRDVLSGFQAELKSLKREG